jgi:hypothetical protein
VPITVDELIVHDAGPRDVLEVLENRPLLGVPVFPNGMYRVQGLHPLAKEDLTTRGGCMLVQIVESLMKSVVVQPPRVQVNGVRVRQDVNDAKCSFEHRHHHPLKKSS